MQNSLIEGDGVLLLNTTESSREKTIKKKNIMTNRERLQKVLRGEIPDCVPVAPDFSNMIPARLTGKPFWDLYLYNDCPSWGGLYQMCQTF